MARGESIRTQSEYTCAIKAAMKAGATMVDMLRDGTIRVHLVTSPTKAGVEADPPSIDIRQFGHL